MRYLLLSVLVVCVIGVMIPNAFAATYTGYHDYVDAEGNAVIRFSIEYPTGWILILDNPTALVSFDDQDNWKTNFQVYWNEYDPLYNRSDSEVLRAIERNQFNLCDAYSLKRQTVWECSDFIFIDSMVVKTNDNRKVYFVLMNYTLKWEVDYREHSMIKAVGIISDGDHSWEMTVESFGEDVFLDHADLILDMMKSFSFPTSAPTPTPAPAPAPAPTPAQTTEPISCLDPNKTGANCIMPYFGAIVELDKVYYSSEDDVNIVITAPNFNANPNVIEYIGTDANSRVTIITSQGTLDFYKLKETGVDTGQFVGSISLNSVSTTGMGPWSGNIKTSNQDTITVQFSNTYCQNGIGVMMTPYCNSGNVDIVMAEGFVEGPSVATSVATPTPAAAIPTVVSEQPISCGDGTVLKNGVCVAEEKGGGCLIATAAFGSEMAPQVQFLRELRDNTVLQTESGSAFMTGFNQFYYSFSPAIADYERENPAFKEAVKITLTPLLASLTLLQYADIDSESEMLGYGIGVILLNIGMYFVAPAVLIMTVRKRI